jgi:hypothetical protein
MKVCFFFSYSDWGFFWISRSRQMYIPNPFRARTNLFDYCCGLGPVDIFAGARGLRDIADVGGYTKAAFTIIPALKPDITAGFRHDGIVVRPEKKFWEGEVGEEKIVEKLRSNWMSSHVNPKAVCYI